MRTSGWNLKPILRDQQEEPIQDTPELRFQYIEEHKLELLKWMWDGYPEILEEFIQYAPRYGAEKYETWLD